MFEAVAVRIARRVRRHGEGVEGRPCPRRNDDRGRLLGELLQQGGGWTRGERVGGFFAPWQDGVAPGGKADGALTIRKPALLVFPFYPMYHALYEFSQFPLATHLRVNIYGHGRAPFPPSKRVCCCFFCIFGISYWVMFPFLVCFVVFPFYLEAFLSVRR